MSDNKRELKNLSDEEQPEGPAREFSELIRKTDTGIFGVVIMENGESRFMGNMCPKCVLELFNDWAKDIDVKHVHTDHIVHRKMVN